MVNKTPPANASLGMNLIINYVPPEDKVSFWHAVGPKKESLLKIAADHNVSAIRLIELNFPGSVIDNVVNPDIVNWYLFHHVRFHCREMTEDGLNYMFRPGNRVAVPFRGKVEIGKPEIKKSLNTRFKIKFLGGSNVGDGIVFDTLRFQIWDEKAGRCAFYTYGGTGAGASPLPVSATLAGDWTDFTVTKPMAANQFTGAARFTTGGGGSVTKNFLHLMHLREGIHTIPTSLPIDTGVTLGVGLSSTVGTMTLQVNDTQDDGLVPFKGP